MVNAENTYFYIIDLINVKEDKVSVTLLTPKSNLEKGRFVIPKFGVRVFFWVNMLWKSKIPTWIFIKKGRWLVYVSI